METSLASIKKAFSVSAYSEISVLMNAVNEILDSAFHSFKYNSIETANKVEPLEEVIDSQTPKRTS